MKLALISPIPHLEEQKNFSNIHMVLGHLLFESEQYAEFYASLKETNPDSFIICDNSANEGHMIKDMQLISLAESINADEIIAPDKYHDSYTTINETQSFLDKYFDSHIKNKFSVMAVPQGKTIEELNECLNIFIKDTRINTIGIGYRNLIPALWDEIFLTERSEWYNDYKIKNVANIIDNVEDNCFNYTMSRIIFLKKFINFRNFKKYNKKIHLLGLYNPYELKIINSALTRFKTSYIRSCDSASPFQAAQANITFNENYGVKIKPKEYVDFYQILTDDQKVIFYQNLSLLKEWAKHE